MHEMGIAESVIEAAESELRDRPGMRLKKIGMRVGELAGVDKESLSFCFECLVKDTAMADVELAIDYCRRSYRCPACDAVSIPVNGDMSCSACGASRVVLARGDELEITYLELEEM